MQHPIVSPQEWLTARKTLLASEKEFTRARDELGRLRRELPWTKVEKSYVFDGETGKRSLSELFDGRSQLIIYQLMFGPDWNAGCPHCSHWADNFNSIIVHLNHRDVTMLVVSRAPFAKLAAYRKRMGWSFKWVSSFETDFNFDCRVSFKQEEIDAGGAVYNFGGMAPGATEREGVSVFFKDDAGNVFHTYSAYARGIDMLSTDYNYLDLFQRDATKTPAAHSGSAGMMSRTNKSLSGVHAQRVGTGRSPR